MCSAIIGIFQRRGTNYCWTNWPTELMFLGMISSNLRRYKFICCWSNHSYCWGNHPTSIFQVTNQPCPNQHFPRPLVVDSWDLGWKTGWFYDQWEFQDIPLHRPHIGIIYGGYLQFRILKFPLIWGLVCFFLNIYWNPDLNQPPGQEERKTKLLKQVVTSHLRPSDFEA